MQTCKTYDEMRQQWLNGSEASTSIQDHSHRIRNGYRQIEAFALVLYTRDRVGEPLWISTTFEGIERMLHFARLAYGNNDTVRMEEIREAIKMRGVNGHRN
jgi:hypothetical protein